MSDFQNDVAIIIPAYNEAGVINDTISIIPKHFKTVICIDDGSTDNTTAQIAKTRATLVKHPINLGQGAALQTGIDFALIDKKIRYFVTFDADGQHRIKDVETMLDHLRKDTADIILGSRFLGEAKNIGSMKKIILKFAIKFSNLSTGLKLTDTHNGLRVFNRTVAEGLELQMADFAHASEIIERIAEKKYRYEELPVTIVYTDYSRSKGQSIINAVNIGFDLLLSRVVGK